MAATFQLVMKSGPTPGKVFDLTRDEIVIGRDNSADITVSDAEVSRKHARFYLQVGSYMLEDLGSTNGTFVNGQRLMGPHALKNGELIMFGENVGLVYESSSVDMDATIAAMPGQVIGTPPPAVKVPIPQPGPDVTDPAIQWEAPEPAEPAFVGMVPEGPVDEALETEPPKNNTRTWIMAGCGCLLILCCIVVAGAFAVESMNLYCQPPLDILMEILGRQCVP